MDTGSADDHLRRFRDTGAPDALGALFDATAPALFRVAIRLAPDPASAEDALQETFLDLFDAAREWDATRPALPWLAGVLRHRVERVRRRESRRPDPKRLPPPPPPPDPPAAAAAAEDRDRARKAMLDLEEPYRSVALLRWQYGLEPAEIAEVRGEPPGTVWSLLSRAKEKLGKSLAGTGALSVAFLPGAGLESVRSAVIHAAAAKATTAATTAAVGGGLLVSKKVFTIACLLCIALGTTLTILLPRGGVRGRVVDAATGKPVAGARVRLPGKIPEETVTDADGRFALAGEGTVLVAEAEGLVGKTQRMQAGSPMDIVLERGDTVVGRVLAPGGGPVAGASVAIHPRVLEDGYTVRSLKAVTDVNGRFRCERADRESYNNCVVRADGYGKLLKDFSPAKDGPGLVDLGDLVLPPARRVAGTWLSGRGSPVVGFVLNLHGPLDLGRAARAYGANERATTDEAGRFDFRGVAPGRYSLNNMDSWHQGVPRVEKQILVADADVLDVELRFTDAGWLRVRVVDDSGTPVVGVTVAEEGRGLFSRTGSDGVAILENLPAKRKVQVTAQAGVEWGAWKYVNIRVPDPVRPDGGEVTLVVARAAYLRGVVLDEYGDPLKGASVSSWEPGGFSGGKERSYSDMTRDDGTFRIAVPEGTTGDLLASTSPWDPILRAWAKGVKAPSEGLVLRLKRIPKSGSLVYRIVDPAGLPLADLDVLVYDGGTDPRPVRTDGAGRVRMEGLPADEHQVWVGVKTTGPDDPWPLPGGAALPATRWETADGRQVEIRLIPGAEIRGTVEDADGKPLRGAGVYAMKDKDWFSTRGTTDDRGRFRIVVPAAETSLTVVSHTPGPNGMGLTVRADGVHPGTEGLVLRFGQDD